MELLKINKVLVDNLLSKSCIEDELEKEEKQKGKVISSLVRNSKLKTDEAKLQNSVGH